MSPQYPARITVAASGGTGGSMGASGSVTSQDAAAAEFWAYLDRLCDGGLTPQSVAARINATGMANHEPLRSWLELWLRQRHERAQPQLTREVIAWFGRLMDAEMTRQAYAHQDTDTLHTPLLGRPAVKTVPLHPHAGQRVLQEGDPADRQRDTFFQSLDKLRETVERLPELFWASQQEDASAWTRRFLYATAAVACQALRMARQAARYYGQRGRTRRAPY